MFEALLSKGKDFFLRMFDIRVGEFRRVLLMQLNVFLLIQCLWIVKPVVNAQFLSTAGIDKLPLVFLLVALTALAVATAYSRLLNRLPLGTIMARTYMISIFALISFAILLHLDFFKDWMSYVFYIGVALFGLITTSQFWLLGNLVFSSLEAKRLFGIIGAGAIAGGISGGYITSALAPLMDGKNILLVASAMLMVGMRVNHRIWLTFVPEFNRTVQSRQTKTLHEYPLRLIRNSRHLTFLALIMGISVVVSKLIEFQFSSIASQRIQDPEKLTAFFGFWFSTANVISLGVQLLVTQRVLAALGVGRSLFVSPAVLFAGAAAVLYTPLLWAGTSLKILDISLKQSINKAVTELLILPIPMAIKSQAKTFIDVFVDTTATGIGGIILIFLVNGLNLSVRAVCAMILLLIFLWIYFAIRLRREYVLAFEARAGMTRQPSTKKEFRHTATSVIGGIRRTLQTGTTKQILYLLARIEESKDARLMPDTIPLLAHESPVVRQAALRCLYYSTDHTITSVIEPLLKDPDDEVRSRAFSSLLAQTRQNRVDMINAYLLDKDPAVNGAAVVGLATEACDNPDMQQLFNLTERLQEKIDLSKNLNDPKDLQAIRIMIARTIGYGKLAAFYPVLEDYMKDSNPAVVKQAILSAGSSQAHCFIKTLLSFLPNKTTRSSARKALSRYEPAELLPILEDVSHAVETKLDLLIQLPALAETMETQQAVDYLFELVKHEDPTVKMEALESLHTIKARFPHLTIGWKRLIPIVTVDVDLYKDTLVLSYTSHHNLERYKDDQKISLAMKELMELLERRRNTILEHIFWVIGLAYPPNVILPLFKELHHEDPAVRMNAIELLDNILEPALKKIVMPIVETASLETMSDDVMARLDLEVLTKQSSFERLLKGDDDLVKLAVLSLIEAIAKEKYTPLLHLAAKDDNPRISMLAKKMLAQA